MQCAYGYVAHKLFEMEVGLKTGHFAECHRNMSIASKDVMTWHDKLNRDRLSIAFEKFCSSSQTIKTNDE